MTFPRIGQFKSEKEFSAHVASLGLALPCDASILGRADSPLAQPAEVDGLRIGNRWCIHPMEGWDANADGTPSEHTLRRWTRFGLSGAKLIWGGEAFAVREDGRSNPQQLGVVGGDVGRAEQGAARLRQSLLQAHRERFGSTDGLVVGLQLTHSGRFSFPHDKKQRRPLIAYHHPILDRRCGIRADDDSVVATDQQLHDLIDDYVASAKAAQQAGFDFVDLKHCHGYLLHELLSGRRRDGEFGGSFENRTRFLRMLIAAVQSACPGLKLGVRLSIFDTVPYRPDPAKSGDGKLGPGIPEQFDLPYHDGFGLDENDPLQMDLHESVQLVTLLENCGVVLLNATAGSPYYCPHIQRPALFPPSDGYQPPEDPLCGVARQMRATERIKRACKGMFVVGTGYTYLQDFLPQVAQAAVRQGMCDVVGIGRMVLSYWDMIADSLEGKPLSRQRVCRTFSDCTSAPRGGMISGCYPLDPVYKNMPQHDQLKAFKGKAKVAQ